MEQAQRMAMLQARSLSRDEKVAIQQRRQACEQRRREALAQAEQQARGVSELQARIARRRAAMQQAEQLPIEAPGANVASGCVGGAANPAGVLPHFGLEGHDIARPMEVDQAAELERRPASPCHRREGAPHQQQPHQLQVQSPVPKRSRKSRITFSAMKGALADIRAESTQNDQADGEPQTPRRRLVRAMFSSPSALTPSGAASSLTPTSALPPAAPGLSSPGSAASFTPRFSVGTTPPKKYLWRGIKRSFSGTERKSGADGTLARARMLAGLRESTGSVIGCGASSEEEGSVPAATQLCQQELVDASQQEARRARRRAKGPVKRSSNSSVQGFSDAAGSMSIEHAEPLGCFAVLPSPTCSIAAASSADSAMVAMSGAASPTGTETSRAAGSGKRWRRRAKQQEALLAAQQAAAPAASGLAAESSPTVRDLPCPPAVPVAPAAQSAAPRPVPVLAPAAARSTPVCTASMPPPPTRKPRVALPQRPFTPPPRAPPRSVSAVRPATSRS